MKQTIAALSLGFGIALAAAADEFPSRALRFVVPNPAGGTVDIVARAVGSEIGQRFAQPVVVEPKPGGNSLIGMEIAARAAPDGYTVLIAAVTSLTLNPLVLKTSFDVSRAFAPVAMLAATPNVVVVHPALPAKTLRELATLARTQPLNYASGFHSSGMHLAAERLKGLGGFDMNYIPYQGGVQAVLATVGGHAQVAVVPLSDAAPHIASGKLRAIAVTSLERFEQLKDVPTVAETYPGFESVQRFGALVPAGTPKAVIARLGAEMRRAVDTPEVRAMFARQCLLATPMGPEEFQELVRSESLMYAALIRDVGFKAE